MPKKSSASGYRLHIKRLHFAADDSTIRTFKFPLVKKCEKKAKFTEVPKELIDAVKHDDLYIRGPSNLPDYLRFKNKRIYTLIDFWIDSLRAGVVFMPSTRVLTSFVTKIKEGKTIFEKIIDDADPRFKKYFNISKFINEIVEKKEMRKGKKSRASFVNTLNKILKKDLSEAEKAEAEKFITELANAFFDPAGQLKISGYQAQNEIWKSMFRLDKQAVDLNFDLSFFIFPELASKQETTITSENILKIFDHLIQKRLDWLVKHGYSGDTAKKEIDKIIGLSDNFNAFSNYFGEILSSLKNNKVEEVFKLLIKIYPKIGDKEKSQLTWLAKRLQYLEPPLMPGVNGWHDYRSLIGGKLQSWWSNHKNRQQEQTEQIKLLKKELPNLQKFIDHYPEDETDIDEETLLSRRIEIKELIEKIGKATENIEDIFTDLERYEFVEDLLKRLRQSLNEYFQLYAKGEEEKSPEDNKYLKEFWKIKIYKPRSFYGYAQQESLKKIVETTIPTIKQGIELTQHLLQNLPSFVEYERATKEKEGGRNEVKPDIGLRRFLESLRKKIKDDKLNTTKFRDFYIHILQPYLPHKDLSLLIDEKKLNRYTFYKSSYSTSTQKELELPPVDYSKEAEILIKKIANFLANFSEEQLLKDPKLLLDFIETSKVVIARMFRWMKQDREWPLHQFKFDIFPAVAKFIKQLKETQVKTPMLRFIVMNQVFSEFRGAATILSKKYITAKWNVQIIGSNNKFKLAITPKDPNVNIKELYKLLSDKPKDVLKRIKWNVVITTKEGKSYELITVADKNANFKISKEKITDTNLLQICTSKHHLQFLERLIYKPDHWKSVKIRVSEPSLIVEERYQLTWDLKTNLPNTVIYEDNKPKLYYALPLEFSIERDKKESQLAKIKADFQTKPLQALKNYHFLGADIGEYGIAWVILKIDEEAGEIIVKDYGFEYDKQIKKIQDEFKEIQQRARLGVFLEDTTLLAKLRENSIGYLRNKLHDKLINYGGHIIYEANISGFEVGVGRITKIYDSVKRADVGNHPDMAKDVGKTLSKHIWGLKTGGKNNSPGWQVGASGTSYTCINCGRTIYGLAEDKEKWIVLGNIEGESNIYRFKSPKQDFVVLGYSTTKKLPNEIEYKKVRGYVRNFARPPIGVLEEIEEIENNTGKKRKKLIFKIDSETIKRFVLEKNILTKKKLKSLRIKRGNSAIFICPFVGCHAVSDADVQAAVVIALRGYIYTKEFYLINNNKEKKKNTFEISKDNLYNATIQLLQNSQLKGNLKFVYYRGDNAKD